MVGPLNDAIDTGIDGHQRVAITELVAGTAEFYGSLGGRGNEFYVVLDSSESMVHSTWDD